MILAGGLTLAVIVGELDLSVGFAASLHGILVTGLIVHDKLPIPLAVLLVLGAGALIGLVNGLIVTKLRVNSVIATLGAGTIITGLAFAYSAGVPIVAGVPEAFLADFARPLAVGVFPTTSSSWCSSSPRCGCSSSASALGQEIQAVGGNASAARLCRHQRRPHQDHRLHDLRHLCGIDRHSARLTPGIGNDIAPRTATCSPPSPQSSSVRPRSGTASSMCSAPS